MLERYGHGGDVWTAEEALGRTKEQFIDFSSNMNPWGPPLAVKHIVQQYWSELVRYPDPAVRELRIKLSRTYGIPPESILVGNGAAELIDLAVRILQPKVTGLVRPSFSEYEEAVEKTNGHIYDIPLYAHIGFQLQGEEAQKAIRQADLLFLGHPNNPTGRLISPLLLKQILSDGIRVILDEAFIDFAEEEERFSLIREAASSPHLFVIRSMTKFYAIPGIRLGYIVAHPDSIQSMKRIQVQWSVNSLAQLIGSAVLEEREYAVQTKYWLQEERPWFSTELEKLGLTVYTSDTNFLLFSLPQRGRLQVQHVQKLLGLRGILIRDASLFKGLDSSYCRVAIRLRADNERFIAEMQQVMAELEVED